MSDCTCIYVDSSDNLPSFHNTQTVVSRKVHKCGECGGAIEPRGKYETVSGVWDGNWSRYKTCLDCVAIRDAFFCEGYYYGGLIEELAMHIDELRGQISSDCILALPEVARNTVFELMQEVFDELNAIDEEDEKEDRK